MEMATQGKLLSVVFSVIVVIFSSVLGHPGYRLKIPNGLNVPNPCLNVGGLWNGVGHNIEIGGGALNPFGKVSKTSF